MDVTVRLTTKLERESYDKAVRKRQDLMLALGPDRIRDAERRLCMSCRYQSPLSAGLCGMNQLMVPLTEKGEDCPYFLSKSFTTQPPRSGS